MLLTMDIISIAATIMLAGILLPLAWYLNIDYLHPFFTKQIIEISKQNDPSYRARYLAIHIVNIALMLFYMLHTCYALFAHFIPSSFPVAEFDLFVRLMHIVCSGRTGYFGMLSIILFYAFCLTGEYMIYISLPADSLVWQKYHDLILRNYLTYRDSSLNSKEKSEIDAASLERMRRDIQTTQSVLLFLPKSIREAYFTVYCRCKNRFTGQYIDLGRFQQCRLNLLDNLSLKLRIKFAILVDALEFGAVCINGLFLICIHSILPIIGWIYLFQVPIWTYPFILLEGLLFGYTALRMCFMVILLVDISILIGVLYKEHTRELTEKLNYLKRAIELMGLFGLNRSSLTYLVTFLREHTLMCKFILMNNRETVGRIMFIALLANVPVNVYILHKLVHEGDQRTQGYYYLYLSFFVLQVDAILLAIVPLGNIVSEMHAAHRIVPALMYHLDARRVPIQLKWTYLVLYERLTTGPKYGISIGPISIITNRIILEIGILYIGLLMNLFALTRHRY